MNKEINATPTPPRILNLRQVLGQTGLSRATLYRLRARREFPEPKSLSVRRVGWLLSDVEDWIESRLPVSKADKSA